MFLSLLGAIAAAPVQQCANTNRLCVEVASLVEGNSFNLFYPSNLFPIEVDTSSLVLNVYLADTITSLNFDPCRVPGTLVSTSPIASEATNTGATLSGSATINFNSTVKDQVGAKSNYILQLTDKDARQCILGPNIGSNYAETVIIEKSTTTTSTGGTTGPTSTSTIVEPDSELPVEGGSNSDATTKLIVIAFIIIVALVILATILLCRRRMRKNVPPPKTASNLDTTRQSMDASRQSMDVRPTPYLGPQNSLPRIEEGNLGIEDEHPEWNNDDTMTRRVDKWASGIVDTTTAESAK